MLKTLNLRYWWCGITQDVQHYVKCCRHCLLRKVDPIGTSHIPHQVYPTVRTPFKWIHIDLIVRLPETSAKSEYIVVIYLLRLKELRKLPRLFFAAFIVLTEWSAESQLTEVGNSLTIFIKLLIIFSLNVELSQPPTTLSLMVRLRTLFVLLKTCYLPTLIETNPTGIILSLPTHLHAYNTTIILPSLLWMVVKLVVQRTWMENDSQSYP
jgi:hypothetical protein